jgi:hypothetical protein
MKRLLLTISLVLSLTAILPGQKITIDRNKPEKLQWFRDMGFGMFIHWSIDVQLGAIISHNVAVGSQDYQDRYFNELPKTFNPKKFEPESWAKLAKLAGMKYMVFTAKHHNGFCMWDTQTSEFNIINSGYGRDILKEIITAFRKYDIAIGYTFLLTTIMSCISRDINQAGNHLNLHLLSILNFGKSIKSNSGNYSKIMVKLTFCSSMKKVTGPIRWSPTMPGILIRIC